MAKNRKGRKAHQGAYARAMDLIEKEGQKQIRIFYPAAAIVLWNDWNKRQAAIRRFFADTAEVRRECAGDNSRSMVQICEEETGIEIQNGNGKSWRDMIFLNVSLDTGKMTAAKVVYMRQQQINWVAPQTMACLLVTLHRRYGFGAERCARIYGQIEAVKEQYGNDPDGMCRACAELTGISIEEISKGEGEKTADETFPTAGRTHKQRDAQ